MLLYISCDATTSAVLTSFDLSALKIIAFDLRLFTTESARSSRIDPSNTSSPEEIKCFEDKYPITAPTTTNEIIQAPTQILPFNDRMDTPAFHNQPSNQIIAFLILATL